MSARSVGCMRLLSGHARHPTMRVHPAPDHSDPEGVPAFGLHYACNLQVVFRFLSIDIRDKC